MKKSKTTDKTVYKSLGFCGFGTCSNVAAVDVKDGRVARVRPLHYTDRYTPEELNAWRFDVRGHVFEPGMKSLLPPFSLAYKKRTYSPNRIPYPLKRIDWDPNGERNPQNRGKSKYVRISWDEAASLVAQEIVRIHKEYSPYSILCQGDGHGETKTYHGTHGNHVNLLHLCGGCTEQARQPDSWEGWYWGAKHVWGMDPVGQNIYQNNLMLDIATNSDALLFWGCDPETTPWGWGGQMSSRLCYWFTECGVKQIYICPDVNYGNAVHADKWIPILPNTDAALQLAIAYVWIEEGTYDREYLDTHADGFDWFVYYVTGGDDGIPKTPQWAAEKCGIPSYRIKALARYWAKHLVSIAHGNGGGYVRSAFAHEPARLEICLLGMQGLGKNGANQVKFLEWTLFGMESVMPLPPSKISPTVEGCYHGWALNLGPSFIPKTMVHKAILSQDTIRWSSRCLCTMPRADQFNEFQFPLEGHHPIHMIWTDGPCWETCWNGGNEYQDAMRHDSIECIVAQHPWLENDCLMADIILPASSNFELRDINADTAGGQFSIFYMEERAIEPVGDTRGDYECAGEVAKKLQEYGGAYENIYERYTGGMTEEEWLEKGYNESGVPLEEMSFEEFKEAGFWMSPTKEGWENDPVGMINFYTDPAKYPLTTPTGKLEYYSSTLKHYFPDDNVRGPYPKWIEETEEHKERITSERAKDYPFLLVSNHPRWRVHAQHDDITWLREIGTCKVTGPDGYKYEPIWVNPVDAEKCGLKNGDIARLYNERGSVLGGVIVSERIMPGVLYQDHGARVDSIIRGIGGLDRGGANNLICPSATTSKNAPGEVTNGFLVGIEKVDVFKLAEEYPKGFGRAYEPSVGLIASAWIVEEDER